MLDTTTLRSVYSYDPVRGLLAHLHAYRNLPSGRPVYCVKRKNGYLYTKIGYKYYLTHRVIWIFVTGEWPPELDHKDGNKLNNAWGNLRVASRSQNMRNLTFKPNKLGFRGVARHGKKFRARIANNGKYEHLGVFDSPEEAYKVYMARYLELAGGFCQVLTLPASRATILST